MLDLNFDIQNSDLIIVNFVHLANDSRSINLNRKLLSLLKFCPVTNFGCQFSSVEQIVKLRITIPVANVQPDIVE
ncbi:hypothetical protein DERP_004094 [Dermatophagoides pteronyssinus]|uniref:Uncharacterized protein n=1 Tax=Dermatophagoides pteronyssinus TaxID=6956 RepID=A0ABQ8J871_DERPT|nr:hypothetical protein DERP_004094 [Dermatophagoides pteronyssinus]